ncbi:MAG: hypothetical protein QM658_14255 [Gordonia sp. (in: high G+C Gram-positive bacteria)]
MTIIIATAMIVALLSGIILGLSWPPDDFVDDGSSVHPLDGPDGPIVRDGDFVDESP